MTCQLFIPFEMGRTKMTSNEIKANTWHRSVIHSFIFNADHRHINIKGIIEYVTSNTH